MASGTFQSLPVPTTALDGRISAIVLDPGGNPADVVDKGTPVTVRIDWNLTGFLVPLISGTWNVQVKVDEIGGPDDFGEPQSPASIPLNGGGDYQRDIVLNSLQAGRTYSLLVQLTYRNPAGAPAPLGGYVNVGTVNVLL
ncbi:hypothetical protein [Streptomyces cupreus]|uniref:Fibronectin type-III domain-containing protein n=1 Tax=Streptomyces cupreus TaxID=2759956 RepID=A0A7X1JCF7_9ACTN|nr:hypothetical protein [Streptomyces cupreus]MBC2907745.1 hypothetical protein [Streptomyces cupreus]